MSDFAISPCHTPATPIYTHIHNRRDTMDRLDDFFFYGIMATLFASTLAVGILAALHETALLAGGV